MVAGFLISLAGIGLWHIADRYEKNSMVIVIIYRLLMIGGILTSILFL